jgi:hypothetical protein
MERRVFTEIRQKESGPIRVLGRNVGPLGIDVSVGRWVSGTVSRAEVRRHCRDDGHREKSQVVDGMG